MNYMTSTCCHKCLHYCRDATKKRLHQPTKEEYAKLFKIMGLVYLGLFGIAALIFCIYKVCNNLERIKAYLNDHVFSPIYARYKTLTLNVSRKFLKWALKLKKTERFDEEQSIGTSLPKIEDISDDSKS